jgi:hypothetical protein
LEPPLSVACHGRKEGHINITAVTYYYYCIFVHISTYVTAFDDMRELNKGITGIQNKVVKCSVVTTQAAGIKGAGSAIQKLAILRQTTAGQCHSASRSSESHHAACRISVSHQLAIVSVLRQLAVIKCHSSWQGFSVAATRKFKFACTRQGFCVPAAGSV